MQESTASLKIGLIAPEDNQTQSLSEALNKHNVLIHCSLTPESIDETHIALADIDIWLVSIDDDHWSEGIDLLMDQSVAPLYFNEHSALSNSMDWKFWSFKLIQRLRKVIAESQDVSLSPQESLDFAFEAVDDFQDSTQQEVNQQLVTEIAELEETVQILSEDTSSASDFFEIWVLGSSFGGPAALKKFFDALPKVELPVAIVLVQHIDQGHMTALKEIIKATDTPFNISVIEQSDFLQRGKILIAPFHKKLTFVPNGLVATSNEPWTRPFAPNVNDVIDDVCLCFEQKRGGVIIFSGLSDDGSMYLNKVRQNGWPIWAQDEASCTNSSMPDAARSTGFVDFSADPEQLALRFYQHFVDRYPSQVKNTELT